MRPQFYATRARPRAAGERPAHARRYLADCGLPKERTSFEGVMCKICTLLLDRVTGKVTEKVTENQRKILSVVAQNSRATQDEIAQMVGISRVHTAKNLKKLAEMGLVKRVGPDKGGHWEVLSED